MVRVWRDNGADSEMPVTRTTTVKTIARTALYEKESQLTNKEQYAYEYY